jgi:pyruvate/2-oxoglutarate dehydrogenase complex dihydrolipoamide acyltransferase (E2) component
LDEIRIAKLGMSTVDVDVVSVLIEVGQLLAVGDPLCEVETEKAQVTLEADRAGTVTEVLVKQGETYVVGDIICRLDI